MRKNIAAGNWKMNTTLDEGLKLASEVVNMSEDEVSSDTVIIMAPPFTHLGAVAKLAEGKPNVFISAQNCHQEKGGAYTGEIAIDMLVGLVDYVILGHSERRDYFGETNDLLASKVDTVLGAGLQPIYCCGEHLEVREANNHFDLVSDQISEGLFHLSADDLKKVVIAYEPVWAIGTGVTASAEQAQEMHKHIREGIAAKYGEDVASEISILYGGSVKPGNAEELFGCEDVDGGLVGGASLKSRDFVDIAKSF